MGTFFELQISHACEKPLTPSDLLELQKKLDLIESEMSLYQKNSPINQLNRDGLLKSPPPHLLRVLKKSIEISEKTKGIFDVTVQNRKAIGWKNIELNEKAIQFKKPGTQITLDGIAKGYAVDVIAEDLITNNITSFLLNFSGNMRWQGRKADNQYWKIQIWNPIKKIAERLALTEFGAIASSSREHNGDHIVDPKKQSGPSWMQTTVVGPSAEICDALSTATFLMSESDIKELLATHFKGYSVYAIQPNGNTRQF
jgi:FAD:protein FMN transferase